jgi:hypothetical protein
LGEEGLASIEEGIARRYRCLLKDWENRGGCEGRRRERREKRVCNGEVLK